MDVKKFSQSFETTRNFNDNSIYVNISYLFNSCFYVKDYLKYLKAIV